VTDAHCCCVPQPTSGSPVRSGNPRRRSLDDQILPKTLPWSKPLAAWDLTPKVAVLWAISALIYGQPRAFARETVRVSLPVT
jgi:hypothetical protein